MEMKKSFSLLVLLLCGPYLWAQIPEPAGHFGFEPGSDRTMFTMNPWSPTWSKSQPPLPWFIWKRWG